jgi:signal transduction histidine kinase
MAAPFLSAVVLMSALAVASVDILSSVRAYSLGESLWSKGQAEALHSLERYAESSDSAHHRRFLEAIALPMGCRRARLELERPQPDLDQVRRGFLEGGNHPDDVGGMIRLYRLFRHVGPMADAIAIWAQADEGLVELNALGEAIHRQVGRDPPARRSPELRAFQARLPALNGRLTALEHRFSAKLGEASRLARNVTLVTIGGFAVLLLSAGLWLTFHLLHQQRLAQRAFRESIERWGLAAEAAGIGVFDWDVTHDCIAFDARAAALCRLEGHAPEKNTGSPAADADGPARSGSPVGTLEFLPGGLDRDAVHADDLPRLRQTLHEAIERVAPLVMRYRLAAPGPARHVELNARVRVHHRGDVRMVGILRDVSDDVLAEQLRLDKQAAERANRAKGAFLSRVSHELRTPLNAVLGFSQLLQIDTAEALTPTQAQRVQYVIDSGRRLLQLIDDMLDVSSLDDGALRLASIRVDVVPLLNASRRRIEPVAVERGVPIACEWPKGELRVNADPRRLEQVFGNLLSNAVKYNRPGGAVRLVCAREGDEAVIRVHDTGPGMGPQQVAQLFQPFNRLGAELSKEVGRGLGLVLSQRLARLMGGSIAVASEPGVGTTFTLRLPLAGDEAPGR